MKRSLFLLIVLLVCLLPVCTFAHSGRTDSNGGHYDRSTGEYHYHHGHPAHQHENGVCPYEFDDKTGHSSGSSSAGSSTDRSSLEAEQPESEYQEKQNEPTLQRFVIVLLSSLFLIVVIWGILSIFKSFSEFFAPLEKLTDIIYEGFIASKILSILLVVGLYVLLVVLLFFIKPFRIFLLCVTIYILVSSLILGIIGKRSFKQKEELNRLEQEKQKQKLKEQQRRFEEKQKYYTSLYGSKPINKIIDMPQDSTLDDLGRPYDRQNDSYWGSYTFYISTKGKKYHTKDCRFATHGTQINAVDVLAGKYIACSYCHPVLPDTSWVKEYKHVQRIKKKYNIE